MRYSAKLVALSVAAATAARGALAQEGCPRAELPAYAHNDYDNRQPLFDALRLGYTGVEADVFLVDGQLRVGHDRKQATRSPTFEELYLRPIDSLSSRCRWIVDEHEPFLLNVELKEASRAAFDSLLALINRYREVLSFAAPESLRERTATIMLVGWHPPIADLLQTSQLGSIRFHHKLTWHDQPLPGGENSKYLWMLSVDYGKSIQGWWRSARRRERWLRRIRQLTDSGWTIRVYNVPVDSGVYYRLLSAGVELIGTESLVATRDKLLPLVRLARCYTIDAGPWVTPPDAESRYIPPIPRLVMRDSSRARFIFEKSAWRRLIVFHPAGAREDDWMWHSTIGALSITNSGGSGGVSLDFRIAGDSIHGRAEVFTDMVNAKYPSAPARGRAVPCPNGN